MKSLILAGLTSVAFVTAGHADQYWVAHDRSTGKCDIVTTQPIVFALPAYDSAPNEYRISFASGPYQSLDDAKVARSGISACPPSPEQGDSKEG